jgi:hypothetical protein
MLLSKLYVLKKPKEEKKLQRKRERYQQDGESDQSYVLQPYRR